LLNKHLKEASEQPVYHIY